MSDSYEFWKGKEPQYKIGSKVWCLQGPVPRVYEDEVLGIECMLLEFAEKSEEPAKTVLACTGYKLSHIYWDAYAWPPHCVFGSPEEPARLSQWSHIGKISDKEWQAAIGNRDDESHYDSELEPCCANISQVRDLLYQCKEHGGLPLRGIGIVIEANLTGAHPEILEEPPLILGKIWKQLNISLGEEEDDDE